jgi:protease-4
VSTAGQTDPLCYDTTFLEVAMAKGRTLFLGAGCLLVVLGLVIAGLAAIGMRQPALGRRAVLAVRLDRSIVERVRQDPLAEIAGKQPIGLRDLRKALRHAASDDRIVGVRLRVDRYSGSIGVAQEIRDLLAEVRTAGKWTTAYLETAGEFMGGNLDYLVAASCDDVSLNPMGDVNLIGLSIRFPFVRGSLDKLGIRPEYPGRGDYKDARFMYTHRDFTPAQREMMEWLGSSLTDQLVEDIATSRGMESDRVRYLLDRGPYLGDEAAEAGLVDRLEDWQEFRSRVDRESEGAETVGVRDYLGRAVGTHGGPKIAVVTASGTILRGESGISVNPLTGGDIMGSETIARAFRNARATRGVKAVVFRVDSPSGTPLASEIIRREMALTADRVPVVVSMVNTAASGGYWIACGAHRFVANRGALVGSIGVLVGHLNMDPFWAERLGVTFGRLDFGANANLYGTLEDWTDPQRVVINRILDRTYETFVGLVADARGMTPEQVDALGQGRVYTGVQAKANGLIDEVGGFDVALAAARELAGISPEERVELVDFPKIRPWWKQFLGRRTAEGAAIRDAVGALEQAWRNGFLAAPGMVWMPPVYIQ